MRGKRNVLRGKASESPKAEPVSPPPADPSDNFLERKAQKRAEAAAEPKASQKTMDHRRFYRADTSSGAFRAWSISGK